MDDFGFSSGSGGGSGGSTIWGNILGILSNQTDLQNALNSKYNNPTGTTTQYLRGDGSIANFPTAIGGGASVSYYLNGSINQGTFSGNTYYQMGKTPVIGTGTNFTINSNGYIAQFITDVNDPSQLNIPAGNWNFEMYFQASSGGGSPSFYVELYKWDGTAFTLIASSSTNPEGITNGTATDLYTTALAVPTTTLSITDRLAVRVYVNNSGKTITLHTEDNNLCQVITTFTTGITAINGLTAQVQTFATGTSGTDFNIVSSGSTHTFNLPTASATNRGALSSADWSMFNGKQNAITLTTSGSNGPASFLLGTLNIPNYTADGLLPNQSGNNGRFLTTNGNNVSWATVSANITIGTTPIASGTVGRVLFEGVGNVLQENSNLNFDTTNGLIIGGATASGTRLTVVNSANTQATKIFVQRNAVDSADFTTLRGDGSVDFANIGSTANVLVYANGSSLIQTYGSAGLRNSLFGIANATSITGGTVAYNTFVGAESTLSSSTGTTAYNTAVGFTTNITNANNCTILGTFTRMNGATRAIVIGGRSTAGPVRDVTGTDVILFGYGTDANALNYTNSAVFYFNNTNASIWFQSNGNLGLFGKKYQILNDSTGTAANRLNTYMDINATNTLTIHNGTPTSSQIADAVQVYGADVVAGNTALFVRTENNDIVKIYSIGGWGTPTGTLTTTTFDTATVTLAQLAERVAALISDLKTGHQLLKS